jgi:probable O-glycosylation ligase (exosortase A-associated)
MSIRDALVFFAVFAAIPFILRRPVIGIFVWVWLGLMNPHRLTWGPAYDFPFAQMVAIVTLIALVFSREPKQMKGGAATAVLICFVLWTCVTTAFALVPESAVPMLERVVKIQFVTILALFLLYKKEHVITLMWVIVLSIGYFSVKGGMFTIINAGNFLVWGPPASFIQDNNAFALAAIMAIPLMAYLYIIHPQRWVKFGLAGAMALTAASAFGSHSRGGLLAIAAMGGFLWLKSRRKVFSGILLVAAAMTLVAFMPEQWEDRMASITEYKEDSSAQGRINTWQMLTNLAMDRPLVGGGFEPYQRWVFDIYKPDYPGIHSAHSIYFQVLGEHGFVGFGLMALFWLLVWAACSSVARMARGNAEEAWAYWLAQMVKVSLVGYFVGGAFLNLAYWDVPYYLFVAIAVARFVLVRARREEQARNSENLLRTAAAPA